MHSLKVFIVEDDEVLLGVFHGHGALEKAKGIRLVKYYASPLKALEELEKHKPDILVTDLFMPIMSGIELISRAKEALPPLKIIAISGVHDMSCILDAIKAGAVGFLFKPFTPTDILKAIEEVEGGGSPLNTHLSRLVIEEFQKEGKPIDYQPTDQEKEMLEMIARGLTYKEVADAQNVSIHSVQWHMRNIIQKLSALNKKDAVNKAKRLGLIE